MEGAGIRNPANVYGSYIHGLFDQGHTAEAVIRALAKKRDSP